MKQYSKPAYNLVTNLNSHVAYQTDTREHGEEEVHKHDNQRVLDPVYLAGVCAEEVKVCETCVG